jgi:hypothetical protein
MHYDIERQEQPEILVVHSENVVVMEQMAFDLHTRELVMVCNSETGYVAVGKKAPTKGYVTLGRWQLEACVAVSFSVPRDKTMRIECVSLKAMLARYESERHLWKGIVSAMRHYVPHVITR